MAVKKKILDQFIYINYIRENFDDFNTFKRELENILSFTVGERDVVVDFIGSNGITSSEIGLLVRAINSFKGTARYIRIVCDDKIAATIQSTNLQQLDNFLMYGSQQQFVDELKKLSKKK